MPYLFLLCSEGLTSLLKQIEIDNKIIGVFLCKNGPRISHLFFFFFFSFLNFANDSLLFYRAQLSDIQTILDILETYERASR